MVLLSVVSLRCFSQEQSGKKVLHEKAHPSLNVLQQRPSTNVPQTRLTAVVASYSAGSPLRPAPIEAVEDRTVWAWLTERRSLGQ